MRVGISITTILLIILIISLIGMGIYFIAYKMMINKRLQNRAYEDDSVKPTRMFPLREIVLIVAILVLFANLIAANEKIDMLSNNIDQLNNTGHEIQQAMDSNYYSLKQTLVEQKSLYSDFRFSYGKYDVKTKTGEVMVHATPKETGEAFQYNVYVGEEKYTMEKKGAEYVATINLNVFKDDYEEEGEKWKIERIDADGISSVENIPDSEIEYYNATEAFLPIFDIEYDMDYEFSESGGKIGGTATVYYSGESKVSARNIIFKLYADDTLIEEKTVKYQGESAVYNIDKKVEKAFDTITITATATDSNGYRYEMNVAAISDGRKEHAGYSFCEVYDENGEFLGYISM